MLCEWCGCVQSGCVWGVCVVCVWWVCGVCGVCSMGVCIVVHVECVCVGGGVCGVGVRRKAVGSEECRLLLE